MYNVEIWRCYIECDDLDMTCDVWCDTPRQVIQGCHSQGKSQGKKYFFKIMEKSWNFVTSQ